MIITEMIEYKIRVYFVLIVSACLSRILTGIPYIISDNENGQWQSNTDTNFQKRNDDTTESGAGAEPNYEINALQNFLLSENNASPAVSFRAFGETLVLVDDNLMHLHMHDDGQIFMELLTILPIVDDVEFIETIQCHDVTFILISFWREKANLYKSTQNDDGVWSKMELIQIISSHDDILVAAKFVYMKDDVYLVAGFQHHIYGSTNSIIYLWSGTHFDEIKTILTSEVIDISIIKRNDYFVIALAQSPRYEPTIGTLLYKYSPESGLAKWATLPSFSPTRLFSYEKKDLSDFLLIANSGGKSVLYNVAKDNGIRLQSHIDLGINVTCGAVTDLQDDPIIVVAGKDRIFVLNYLGHEITNISLPGVKVITDLKIMPSILGDFTVVAVSRFEEVATLTLIQISLKQPFIPDGRDVESTDGTLLNTLEELSRMLNERQVLIEGYKARIKEITHPNGIVYDEILYMHHPILVKNSKVGHINLLTTEDINGGIFTVDQKFQNNEEVLRNIEFYTTDIVYEDDIIEINGDAVFEGDLLINNFKGSKIETQLINGRNFHENFLLFNEKGHFTPHQSRENDLTLLEYDASSQPIRGSMEVNNLFIGGGINDVDPNNVVTKDYQRTKTVDNVLADDSETYPRRGVNSNLGQQLISEYIPKLNHLYTSGDVLIEELFIEELNGLNMSDLMENAYQRHHHTKIEGNLHFKSQLDVGNLIIKIIEDIPAEHLLTKTTPQNVTSLLHFRNMLTKDITVGEINGLDLDKDIAIIGQRNIIQTPVTVPELLVKKDLHLNCENLNTPFCKFGLLPENKLQIYNGMVEINGTLTVSDLSLKPNA